MNKQNFIVDYALLRKIESYHTLLDKRRNTVGKINSCQALLSSNKSLDLNEIGLMIDYYITEAYCSEPISNLNESIIHLKNRLLKIENDLLTLEVELREAKIQIDPPIGYKERLPF